MTRKPTTLAAAMTKKPAPSVQVPPEPAQASGPIVNMTIRLPAPVHDQIREMAFHSRRSQHSLLLEALNLLFEKHDKPTIAP